MAAPFRLKVSDRFGIAVIVAMLLASTTLLPLTQDRSYLALSAIGVLALGGIGILLRRMRLNEGVVLGVQVLLAAAYVFAISLGMPGTVVTLFRDAIVQMQTQPAPIPANPGVTWLFVVSVCVVTVLTDVLVQGVDRPLWAIAPLASLFLVPALALPQDVSAWTFVVIAVGYLGILLAEGINTSERWPRGVRRSEHDRGSAPLAWQLGALVAVPAVVLALLLGAIAPTLPFAGWGAQKDRGEGPLQMTDPTLDLRQNLNQPQDRVVMTYQTDQPGGSYLRMASLPVTDGSGWHNAPVQLTTGTDLPPAPGYKERPGQRVRNTDIKISDFRSEYLPLPFATDSFSAPGSWGYDRDSLVVLATSGDRTAATQNLSYSAKSLDIVPDGAGLSNAQTSNPPDSQMTVPVPGDVPEDIVKLAVDLTRDAPTPALKAAAIQKHLRSQEFTYSTEPQPGSGYEVLQNFLFRSKRGYCEQFASSMALMARVAGIPSRVAVGFLPGERQGNEWEVSIRDMHAWPELWFEGYGWVRFEPTPSVAAPPAWTISSSAPSTEQPGSTPAPTPTESAAPTEESTPTAEPTQAPAPVPGSQIPWGRLLLAGAGVLVLAALAATPMLVRNSRRNSRLTAGGTPVQQVENAWAEVRDSVIDLQDDWPAGSPRVIGEQLAHDLDPEAADSMRRMALMVERARYAREPQIDGDLAEDALRVRHGLAAGRDTMTQFWSTWWPRSLFLRRK